MAMRVTIQKGCNKGNFIVDGLLRRLIHSLAISPSFTNSIDPKVSIPEPEPEPEPGFRVPFPGDVESLDLMAVPKQKISKRRRRIRNGPKALKPIPVIVRCTCCGRVKLPHFYCCSGHREEPRQRSDATN